MNNLFSAAIEETGNKSVKDNTNPSENSLGKAFSKLI